MPDSASRTVPRRRREFRWRSETRAEPLAGPLRGELLGAEHFIERLRAIARAQELHPPLRRTRRDAPLLNRLEETWQILEDAHARLSDRGRDTAHIGPAGEWLLDNFYVVREHIREVHESLPRDYYRELPELRSGALAGYPRVYELAITVISHSEARIDRELIDRAVSAFQSVSSLSIGELWALPAMLRLGLIESIRRMTLRTMQRLEETDAADRWAQRLETSSEAGDREFRAAMKEFVNYPPPLSAIFVSRFLHQIHLTRGSYPPYEVLERWIEEEGMSEELAAAQSTERLALTQIVMAHSITSLRAIAALDWKKVVEEHSALEAVLRQDPSGFYRRMTFSTRDRYRHVVEGIARRTERGEEEVASLAITLAREGMADPALAEIVGHVGYYLVDDGRPELERRTGYRPRGPEVVHRWMLRRPDLVLGGGIAAGTVLAIAAAILLGGESARSAWLLVALVALIPATDVAVSTLNQLLTAFLPPRMLPKLDLRGKGGVPAEYRTAVVMPTLFEDVAAVEEALEAIEVQFLANRQRHVHFVLLGDFTDSPSAIAEGDEEILAAAIEGVRGLVLFQSSRRIRSVIHPRRGGGAEDDLRAALRPRGARRARPGDPGGLDHRRQSGRDAP